VERLDITLWPFDHWDMPFAVPRPHVLRYKEGKNASIAQINLTIDSRTPKSITSELLATINKWPEPPLKDLSEIPVFGPPSHQLDPQFVLHVLPSLEVNTSEDVANFVNEYGILNLKEYKNMKEYMPTITQATEHKESITAKDLLINNKKYGDLISIKTDTALAMVRDLKAMAKHIIAYSNNEPEWEPWEEAGYTFTSKEFSLMEARNMLRYRLTQGLGIMSLTPIFDFKEKSEIVEANTKAKSGLYQAACIQILKFYKTNRPISQCSHVYCDRFFSTATGYDVSRSQRTTGLKYCSKPCAKAANQLRYRRKKQGVKA